MALSDDFHNGYVTALERFKLSAVLPSALPKPPTIGVAPQAAPVTPGVAPPPKAPTPPTQPSGAAPIGAAVSNKVL